MMSLLTNDHDGLDIDRALFIEHCRFVFNSRSEMVLVASYPLEEFPDADVMAQKKDEWMDICERLFETRPMDVLFGIQNKRKV